MSKSQTVQKLAHPAYPTKETKIKKLKKYKLSPDDQNILNLKYIDFTSDNPNLLNFLRLKPCIGWSLMSEIRETKIWNNFQDSFYSELLNIAINCDYKDQKKDYSFYDDGDNREHPLEAYLNAFNGAVERFDINFYRKTFPKNRDLKRFISMMIRQEFLKSKQWHYSFQSRNQRKIIKTKLEELLLSLPLEADYFDTYTKNFQQLTYRVHLNNYDALFKYIKKKDEIAVMDLNRIPSKILNLDVVMQTLYSNIIKQKNKLHYADRMLKFFLYTKKNKFWDLQKISEVFSLQHYFIYYGSNIDWYYFSKITPHLKVFAADNSKDYAFQAAYINFFINRSGGIVNIPSAVSDKYFDEEFWSIIHPKLMTDKLTNELLKRSIKRGIIPDILQLTLLIKKATE